MHIKSSSESVQELLFCERYNYRNVAEKSFKRETFGPIEYLMNPHKRGDQELGMSHVIV